MIENFEFYQPEQVEYGINDIDDTGLITYIGKETADGTWVINKLDTTSGIVVTYASIDNNPTITSYQDAWTDRATLTYGLFNQV